MEKIFTHKKYTIDEMQSIPSSTLAWIGDSVFSVCVREYELSKCKSKPYKLNRKAVSIENAQAQAESLEMLLGTLNEIELGVVRRAKNSPITTKSKHFGLAEYKKATALEALLGYLYLTDNITRLNEIVKAILEEER
ncbi:MAG: ribonuclease III [Clostridia bacterium]|nr:ribonuclease III [Clostridia bacterium]